MRDVQELSNILWERIFKLRNASCIGCICEYSFNKFHEICLSDAYHNYFYTYSLHTLLTENLINNHEKQILENIQNSMVFQD